MLKKKLGKRRIPARRGDQAWGVVLLPLMIYGSLGAGICCVILGTQIHMHWGPHWMTALFIYLFSVMYVLGAGTVPFVMVAEVFLPEVKSIVSMVSMEWAFVCYFVILLIFNPLVSSIGLGSVFHIFAVVCFLTAIYSVFYVPETMGLTVDVIQHKFGRRKRDVKAQELIQFS